MEMGRNRPQPINPWGVGDARRACQTDRPRRVPFSSLPAGSGGGVGGHVALELSVHRIQPFL